MPLLDSEKIAVLKKLHQTGFTHTCYWDDTQLAALKDLIEQKLAIRVGHTSCITIGGAELLNSLVDLSAEN